MSIFNKKERANIARVRKEMKQTTEYKDLLKLKEKLNRKEITESEYIEAMGKILNSVREPDINLNTNPMEKP
jgi:hypothetical protein